MLQDRPSPIHRTIPGKKKFDRQLNLRQVQTWIAGLICAIVIGAVSASPSRGIIALGMLAVFAGAWGLLKHPPITLGILVVGAQNGLPFVDLGGLAGRLPDIAFFSVLALVAFRLFTTQLRPDHLRLVEFAAGLATPLVIWWAIVLIFTVNDGIPWTLAALYGRDFLYLALLLPCFTILLSTRGTALKALVTVGILASVYALGQVLLQFGFAFGDLFVHPIKTSDSAGILRVFSYMNEVVLWFACVAVIASATLAGRQRLRAIVASGLSLAALALNQTRAVYVGLPVAFIVTLLLTANLGARQRRVATNLSIVAVALILAVSIAAPALPGGQDAGPVNAVVERVASVGEDVSSESGNVGYRTELIRVTSDRIGDRWLVGLGFRHPDAAYEPDFPSGSIRNSDIGVFGSLITMGFVGTMFLLLIPIGILWKLVVYLRRVDPAKEKTRWIVGVGGVFWLLTVLITSATLGALFSLAGVIFVSFAMAGSLVVVADEVESEKASGTL